MITAHKSSLGKVRIKGISSDSPRALYARQSMARITNVRRSSAMSADMRACAAPTPTAIRTIKLGEPRPSNVGAFFVLVLRVVTKRLRDSARRQSNQGWPNRHRQTQPEAAVSVLAAQQRSEVAITRQEELRSRNSPDPWKISSVLAAYANYVPCRE
jgi:hypothetical protein